MCRILNYFFVVVVFINRKEIRVVLRIFVWLGYASQGHEKDPVTFCNNA